jgi:hypothetical protein
MDIKKYTLDIDKVGKGFKVVDGKWIATGDISITFPKGYLSGSMGGLTNTYNPIGYFAILVGNNYGRILVPMQIPLRPEKASIYTEGGVDYLLLEWGKGGIICDNLRLVQDKTNVYRIHNEFIGKGKTPWYFDVGTRSEIFRNNSRYAGVDLGGGIALESLLVANISRDKDDRNILARYSYKDQADYDRSDIVTIPLMNIAYGAKSGFARTIGGYAEDGIVAELVDPTQTVDKLEQLIRT